VRHRPDSRGEKQQRVAISKTATLELGPQRASLALSRQLGTISLALRSLVDFPKKDGPVGPAEEGGDRRGVNVVRFGVTTTTTTK
jgi:pilus assembly protein CpaB